MSAGALSCGSLSTLYITALLLSGKGLSWPLIYFDKASGDFLSGVCYQMMFYRGKTDELALNLLHITL